MEVFVYEQVLQRGVTVIIVSREVTAASRETDETSHYFVKLKNLFFFFPYPEPGRKEKTKQPAGAGSWGYIRCCRGGVFKGGVSKGQMTLKRGHSQTSLANET